ncbi:hypothetical protein HMPREF9176_1420 [Streptococcus downei F0415]|nr:hypothetical protein HMPREF9176_1420 [Streptococcus downei F0415]
MLPNNLTLVFTNVSRLLQLIQATFKGAYFFDFHLNAQFMGFC